MQSTKPSFLHLSNEKASRLLDSLLRKLKRVGLTASSLEEIWGYPNLSKLRKFETYQNTDSDHIGGKTTQEVLTEICLNYKIDYDSEEKEFIIPSDVAGSNHTPSQTWYVMYHFMAPIFNLGKGILTFQGRKQSTMQMFDQEGKLKSVWEGPCTYKNGYLFIDQNQKTEKSAPRSLQTYIMGNSSRFKDYHIGSYLSVRDDGCPITGQCLLERVDSYEEAEQKITAPDDPRIYRYLSAKTIVSENRLVLDLDDLDQVHDPELLAKTYTFYYQDVRGNIAEGALNLELSGRARLSVFSTKYMGLYSITGPRAINIRLGAKGSVDIGVTMYVPGHRLASRYQLLPGFGIGETVELPCTFPFLLVEKDVTYRGQELEEAIKDFFQEYTHTQSVGVKYIELTQLIEQKMEKLDGTEE